MPPFRPPPMPGPPADMDYEDSSAVDPELRLRTVRTAASTIAESMETEARMLKHKRRKQHAKRLFFRRASDKRKERDGGRGEEEESRPVSVGTDVAAAAEVEAREDEEVKQKRRPVGERRHIYVNQALPIGEQDHRGDPLARYPRNKIRTSKYTILTFIPKNLYEQFRRVANLYFLALVIIQIFPMFGSTTPQIAMLPLVFILAVTALKDGIEDYRRATLDEEVNTSAVTKLGTWRNVNRALDPRTWLDKLRGVPHPDKVTKGVRRLRERDAQDLRHVVLVKSEGGSSVRGGTEGMASSQTLDRLHGYNDDRSSVGSSDGPPPSVSKGHLYPPTSYVDTSTTSLAAPSYRSEDRSGVSVDRAPTITSAAGSTMSRLSTGAMDWQRRTSGSARWERTLWKKLNVGDIVLLRDNEQVPADVVVLSTSDSDGVCYVETKNLDGETNLKPRKSLKATSAIASEEDIEHVSFVLDSDPPLANLYTYQGVLRYSDLRAAPGQGVERVEPVTIDEMLLRGCTLRNTDWVIALVVFTGADTKILLNGGDTPSKRSKIERETNFNVIMNFVVLLVLCVVTGIANGVFLAKTGTSADYYEIGEETSTNTALDAVITMVSCLVAFQNIVPISLYISIEIVKTIQAYFIFQDIDMYYAPLDSACVPKTWNISDDLGQIEYIFSDKTGTLTQNVMEFQRCSVNSIPYGEGITEAMKGAAIRAGRHATMDPAAEAAELLHTKSVMIDAMRNLWRNPYLQEERLTLLSPKLVQHLGDENSPQRRHIIAFFRALALCHTVLPDKPDPRGRPYHVDYKAESPDEAALVAAARDVGFPFLGRSSTALEIEVLGRVETYVPLRVLAFNSTRKRMSVIVRDPGGRIVLYCKGADSVIYARLAKDHDPELKAATQRDLEAFANSGLRTLCVAYRYLTEDEYASWLRISDEAAASIKDREEEIDKANELIEHTLTILGATALEDKLQEGVPDAIELLHDAGIKLWILTGDKLQTAIEIGFSCNLLTNTMDVMILSADSAVEARNQIEGGLNKIASAQAGLSSKGGAPSAGFAVVIDGDTLHHALSPDLKPLFLALGSQCETVVCCRVSPAQKALVVKLVKEGRKAMTLAIGDGANDVAMIQEAHVGCGLLGKEGSQAAMSADYAFAQFRFLTKLLLVHGRWSYIRIAEMHANFFYKNVIWVLAMFWFLFYNSFDATYLFEYTFILLQNLVFTSLPVIVLGAFDQDVNAKAALAFPQLYKRGVEGLEYTRAKFWMYMCDGLYQSAIVYFIPYLVWSLGSPFSWNGRDVDSLGDFGTTAAVAALFSSNIYVAINTKYWTFITWIVIIISNVFVILWISIYSAFVTIELTGEVAVLFPLVNFWATVIISIAMAVGPRFVINFYHQAFFPLDKDIVREMWVAGDLKQQLGLRRGPRTVDDKEFPKNRGEIISDTFSDPDPEAYMPLSALPQYVSPVSSPPRRPMDEPSQPSPIRMDTNFAAGRTGEESPIPMSYYSPSAIRSHVPSPVVAPDVVPEPKPSGSAWVPPDPRTAALVDALSSSPPANPPHSAGPSLMSQYADRTGYEMESRSGLHRDPTTTSGVSWTSDSTYLNTSGGPTAEDDGDTIRDIRRESGNSYVSEYAPRAL